MAKSTVTVRESELNDLAVRCLSDSGMPIEQAKTVADVLVYADLRGVHSHGVLRLEHYTERIRAGGLNLHADLEVVDVRNCVMTLDARGSAGHVATKLAMEAAIDVARREGIGVVGVRNNSHCGALAYYVEMALREKMAAIVATNTNAGVAPFGGRSPFLGTNPFAFGFPGERENILVDMATSVVAYGKIFYAREQGEQIPEGWAIDKAGKPCTDPNAAATLLPFGGAKGYGVGLMVEALTGLMIGGVFGPYVKKMYGDLDSYQDLATFVLVLDPGVVAAGATPAALTQQLIDDLHRQPPAPGFERVKIPGEIEQEQMTRSRANGIEIPKGVYAFLTGGRGSAEPEGGDDGSG